MGTGKSKTVIDAACALYEAQELNAILVLCPAGVRSVWLDPELGQVTRHCWVPARVVEYNRRSLSQFIGLFTSPGVKVETTTSGLTFVVASYEFVRNSKENVKTLARWCRARKTMLVCDESSAIKSHRALQTKAAWDLADACCRRVLLNGTPITNSPLDLYAQFAALDRAIIGSANYYHFRARYARMGGYMNKQVIGYSNLEELNARVAPYITRRLKKECLDLPPKIGGIESDAPNVIEVPLEPEAWRLYKEMRDDLVAYLADGGTALASVAAVKGLRLAQITGGFLGGLSVEEVEQGAELESAGMLQETAERAFGVTPSVPTRVSHAKQRALLEWLQDHGDRYLIWCRFRAEIEALATDLGKSTRVLKLYGGLSRADHAAVVREGETGSGACTIIAQQQAGGLGLQLTSFNVAPYYSNTYSLRDRLQSEDRCHRIGTFNPVTYADFCATGPQGQRTVDHLQLRALRKKQSIATWSTAEWRHALQEEEA